jgi:replicative DNA helicase
MKLSAPVFVLKQNAKKLKRSKDISLSDALDQIAKAEGFNSWSLLQSRKKTYTPKTPEEILAFLYPGDLLLIGARPGLGKTILALQVLLQSIKDGRRSFFFSLEYTYKDFATKITDLDETFDLNNSLLKFDFSDGISSDYIINKTRDSVVEGSIIAIDYLQLLDQQRSKPPIQKQIEDLKKYADEKKCIFIFISQIDRTFDQQHDQQPGLSDVKLPNPLDLGLFNKSIFVQERSP